MNLINNKQYKTINLRAYFVLYFKKSHEYMRYFLVKSFLFKIFD